MRIPDRLVQYALTVVLAAAAVSQLPQFVKAVQLAQLRLLKESQASKWGRPLLLPVNDERRTGSRAKTGASNSRR